MSVELDILKCAKNGYGEYRLNVYISIIGIVLMVVGMCGVILTLKEKYFFLFMVDFEIVGDIWPTKYNTEEKAGE